MHGNEVTQIVCIPSFREQQLPCFGLGGASFKPPELFFSKPVVFFPDGGLGIAGIEAVLGF